AVVRVFGRRAKFTMTIFASKPHDIADVQHSLEVHPEVEGLRQTHLEQSYPSPIRGGFTLRVALQAYFTGRTQALGSGVEALCSEGYSGVVIIGPKRIGKTSLLAALEQEVQRKLGNVLVIPTTWASPQTLSLPRVLQRLSRALSRALPELDQRIPSLEDQ